MIVGDPYKFAVLIKTIKDWNVDDAFCNGILLFFVDGEIYPKEIQTATLKSEVHPLIEKLKNISIDKEIYTKKKEEAFEVIYNITFPDELENDYRFDLSTNSLIENNCYVFGLSNGCHVRILAAKLDYIKEISKHNVKDAKISETIITLEELGGIVSALRIE